MRLHFGLGQASVVDAIEVRWPTTQKTEKFTCIEANRFLTIKEDSGIVSATGVPGSGNRQPKTARLPTNASSTDGCRFLIAGARRRHIARRSGR